MALSVSLTAVVSLLSILTVPVLAAWAVTYFMGDAAPDVSVASLAVTVVINTALTVWVLTRERRTSPAFAKWLRGSVFGVALVSVVGAWPIVFGIRIDRFDSCVTRHVAGAGGRGNRGGRRYRLTSRAS